MTPNEYLKIACGNILVEASQMFGSISPDLWQEKYPPLPGNLIRIGMNSLFFTSGEKKILIDPGMSENYPENDSYNIEYTTPITEQLMSIGVYPQEITDVILTHLHFDHCAGIFHYNKNSPVAPAFPSATLIISQEQYLNILCPDPVEKDSFIENFTFFIEKFYTLKIIEEAEGMLAKNISFRKYSGHSPGMIVPFISINNNTLIYTSDLIPLSINADLKIASSFDLDVEKSLGEMTGLIKEAAENKYSFFLYHELNDPVYSNLG